MIKGMLYRLSLWCRKANGTGPFLKEFCVRVGDKGLYFQYNNPLDLDPRNINRFRGGSIHPDYCIIDAASPIAAIVCFHTEFEGALIGGPRREDKALWINEAEPIIQYPYCKKIRISPRGRYICGEPLQEDPECGEFGGCVVEDLDSPKLCPIQRFLELNDNKRSSFTVEYEGVIYTVVHSPQTSLLEFA